MVPVERRLGRVAASPPSSWATSRACRAARGRRFVVVLALAVLAVAPPALAHDVDGKLGVGFEDTLTNIGIRQSFPVRDLAGGLVAGPIPDVRAAGVAVRRYVGNFGVEGIAGLSVHLPSKKPTEFGAFASLGGLYNVVRSPQVNLAIGARVLIGVARTNGDSAAGPVRVGVALEAPLRVEYFFNNSFAIAGAVGPVAALNGSDANPLTGQSDSVGLSLSRGEFSGGIGFTYYLN